MAETAYNVIQALPQEELTRLYRMLGVLPEEKKEKEAVGHWTKEYAKEWLLSNHFRKSQERNAAKQAQKNPGAETRVNRK